MQLEEQGLVDFNEDITVYLGDVLDLEYDEPITIYNLMNHTAGFEENYDMPAIVSEVKYTYFSKVPLYGKYQPKQIFKPGDYVAYSNYSTVLGGK